MNGFQLGAALEQVAPVELADLQAVAALLTRRDRKYVIPVADATRLVEALSPSSWVLTIDGRQSFRYESVYFDTPGRASYLGAARRRPHRFKVRTRSYLDSGRCLLEIKTRDARGRTVKQCVEHSPELRDELGETGRSFAAACPYIGEKGRALIAVLRTRYSRSTLLLSTGVRVTIDVDFGSSTPDGTKVGLPGMAFVETKSPGAPSDADRALWSIGYRPIRVSKYCTSLAALHPGLPSNKWTRALLYPWITSRPAVAIGS